MSTPREEIQISQVASVTFWLAFKALSAPWGWGEVNCDMRKHVEAFSNLIGSQPFKTMTLVLFSFFEYFSKCWKIPPSS